MFTCGIIVRRLRNVCNPILDMSTPSTRIDPSAASTIRNKLRVKDDFPAPVRPTIPTYIFVHIVIMFMNNTFHCYTFSPPFTKISKPFNTKSNPSR